MLSLFAWCLLREPIKVIYQEPTEEVVYGGEPSPMVTDVGKNFTLLKNYSEILNQETLELNKKGRDGFGDMKSRSGNGMTGIYKGYKSIPNFDNSGLPQEGKDGQWIEVIKADKKVFDKLKKEANKVVGKKEIYVVKSYSELLKKVLV
ncbi:hypothetical protein GPJ56_005058 [Histomonas meleagridis]|uniref:uncharacterized protein n=1 Tax=Histomonas meleagridis TaxID=135588 RepID=UPI003559B070|nr:hypothetical protein GPJ56_005058 [Histomonas meleagridis]KAH0802575.1 hypothetical protein GO595_004624 [Histomonas meleagridis]